MYLDILLLIFGSDDLCSCALVCCVFHHCFSLFSVSLRSELHAFLGSHVLLSKTPAACMLVSVAGSTMRISQITLRLCQNSYWKWRL